ncbi:hypothetical protein [Macrococcus carouselicus]|uniref:Uncharacterized protein n=1 Tax=Macrococcus carouselicus TaxID=69969 RepID=A0A9Q8CJD9_9STAP|nr:hypothetical protein [Macrococcus carouselicus]TDM04169.1 hypothetical protein ERX40_03090 [Macrococcus carouselicus]
MTIRISKDFLLYLFFFIMMTTFAIIYMAQSNTLYQRPLPDNVGQSHQFKEANTHSSTMNGEVLGIVR